MTRFSEINLVSIDDGKLAKRKQNNAEIIYTLKCEGKVKCLDNKYEAKILEFKLKTA